MSTIAVGKFLKDNGVKLDTVFESVGTDTSNLYFLTFTSDAIKELADSLFPYTEDDKGKKTANPLAVKLVKDKSLIVSPDKLTEILPVIARNGMTVNVATLDSLYITLI